LPATFDGDSGTVPAVHCPRCGAHTEQDDRYCATCGATLPGAKPEENGERRTVRDRAAGFVGATPKARMLTGATVVAIVIAVIAFIALDPAEEDSVAQDAYTLAADDICVDAKKQIGRAGQRSLGDDPGAFASSLVPLAAQWRSEFNALQVPEDRADQAAALDVALRDVQVKASELSRIAREGDREALLAEAGELDEDTQRVEEAIAGLGLQKCEGITIAPGAEPPVGG
jgi:hypothetical protein